MKNNKIRLIGMGLLAAVLMQGIQAGAAVIAYDGFDTSATGDATNGVYQSGTTFSDAANNAVVGGSIVGFQASDTWAASLANIQPLDGKGALLPSWTATVSATRKILPSMVGKTVAYGSATISMNLNYTGTSVPAAHIGFSDETFSSYDGAGIGFQWNDTQDGWDINARYRSGGAWAFNDVATGYGIDTGDIFVVWEMDQVNDTLSVWVNPVDTNASPAAVFTDFEGGISSITHMNALTFRVSQTAATGGFRFDDLMLGDEMADVLSSPGVLISDNFNRADSIDLGTTLEGYTWGRYGSDVDKPLVTNSTVYFGDSYSKLILSGAPKLKNYRLDLDFSRPDEKYSVSYFNVSLRMQYNNVSTTSGGTTPGYLLRLYSDPTADTLWAILIEDGGYNGDEGNEYYELASSVGTPVSVADACASFHVSMTLEGRVITVSLNGTEVISYDGSGSINPASNWEGYMNFQAANNRHWAMDNLVVSEVEELPVVLGYAGWADGWVYDIGSQTNDYDGDGVVNLLEYALGGDPINALDQGTAPQCGMVEYDGNRYFGYMHPQLSDPESGLTYSLEVCTDLVSGTWTNGGYEVLGTNVTGDTLNMVTNYTDLADGQKFIRLLIEESE